MWAFEGCTVGREMVEGLVPRFRHLALCSYAVNVRLRRSAASSLTTCNQLLLPDATASPNRYVQTNEIMLGFRYPL